MRKMPEQLVLGIETSCDDTSVAVVREGLLLGQASAAQTDLHSLFGGVVPELASREHYRFLGALLDEVTAGAGIKVSEIDCIAVARGPGLLGSLLVGNAFAKAMALGLGCPVLGVNHLHAHFLVAGLNQSLQYPALGLLVSGGHTHIYKIESPEKFILLGRSIDDAAGEAFDKVGNVLGFSYPAGKKIDEMAMSGRKENWILPRPYLNNDNLDFSFSGLKTAAIVALKERAGVCRNEESLADFCACFNETVAETLSEKLERAILRERGISALWLAGGVAANSAVRRSIQNLAEKHGLSMICPEKAFCTDNGAMIAYSGWLLRQKGYRHNLDFEVIPRGRKIPDDLISG